MATKIQLRRDTAADWTSGNPTLAAGEFAWESDTNRYKIGDGATAWNSLGYADTLSTLGDLSVTGSTISSPSNADLTLTTSGTGDIVLDADGGDIFVKDNGTTFGSLTNTSGNLIIKSGTTTALTFSGANATFAGTLATAAGGFNIAGLDIDGATDIGEAIVDADLFIIDNGAGGTNRKVAASRIVTYIDANSSAASVGKAIAMAIVFG